MVRLATEQDLDAIEQVYSDILTEEEQGRTSIGWVRDVYPTRAVAEASLKRGDLFVLENEEGTVVGTGIINREQVDMYFGANWETDAPEDQVMVLHTLVISPKHSGRGYGREFLDFYEAYAIQNGCPYLRIDTNEKNTTARRMYAKRGYHEADIVVGTFNNIEDVHLVLLEKTVEVEV